MSARAMMIDGKGLVIQCELVVEKPQEKENCCIQQNICRGRLVAYMQQPHPPAGSPPAVRVDGGNKAKRPTTNVASGSGAGSSPLKAGGSTVHSQPKKPSLDDTIYHVFSILKDKSETGNGRNIPPKFFYFYDSDMFRHFLACVVYYFYGFTNVNDLETEYARDSKESIKKELDEAKLVLKHRLQMFAEAYSRLVLHCSNFENTWEDQEFFEFLFEFTHTTCRMAVPEEQWETIDSALGHVFRGYMFNTDELRSPRPDTKLKKKKGGQGGSVEGNLRANSQDEFAEGASISHGKDKTGKAQLNTKEADDREAQEEVKRILIQYARKKRDEFHKVATRLNKNTSEAKNAITTARAIMKSHEHKVTRVPRAKRVREKHRIITKMEQMSMKNEEKMGFINGAEAVERSRRFNIQHAFHARSPMVSLILPTAKEKLEIANIQRLKRSEAIKAKRRKLANPEGSSATSAGVGAATRGRQRHAYSRQSGVLTSTIFPPTL